ncbi:MAG TPA: YugE family protein [Sporosarcina psychrophila]|uniref:YugE family protein n=1 Tax=Sporosarcina psychrophila TaxID=1476 RepID=A0A921FYS8_SPOPS|nr:YugE family protein [Sporosarcina psychrophila]
MQTIEMNKKAIALLEQWDPFDVGPKAYELEIADVVSDLHHLDHPTDLAKRIREIYEHSYAVWIPIENCVQISYKLLAIKYEAKCIV